jgi:histidine decarboxylase
VVTEKWTLASTHGRSHIICMPGVTQEMIDNFLVDMRTIAAPALAGSRRQTTHSAMAPVLRTATPATA